MTALNCYFLTGERSILLAKTIFKVKAPPKNNSGNYFPPKRELAIGSSDKTAKKPL